ncbi:hypothetical protein B0H19DRAFT_1059012 [Mycena capillaripes]|nr:hypothetical protein B0H19DRAFT_1059012 [Mycena capillaripes]
MTISCRKHQPSSGCDRCLDQSRALRQDLQENIGRVAVGQNEVCELSPRHGDPAIQMHPQLAEARSTGGKKHDGRRVETPAIYNASQLQVFQVTQPALGKSRDKRSRRHLCYPQRTPSVRDAQCLIRYTKIDIKSPPSGLLIYKGDGNGEGCRARKPGSQTLDISTLQTAPFPKVNDVRYAKGILYMQRSTRIVICYDANREHENLGEQFDWRMVRTEKGAVAIASLCEGRREMIVKKRSHKRSQNSDVVSLRQSFGLDRTLQAQDTDLTSKKARRLNYSNEVARGPGLKTQENGGSTTATWKDFRKRTNDSDHFSRSEFPRSLPLAAAARQQQAPVHTSWKYDK